MIPEGWPLTLGRRGLVLQLGELEASALRLGECYLCIRSAAAVATTSGSGEVATGDERNTVEVSHRSVFLFFFFFHFHPQKLISWRNFRATLRDPLFFNIDPRSMLLREIQKFKFYLRNLKFCKLYFIYKYINVIYNII